MDEATATALGNLADKTGRTVDDWLAIARPLVAGGHAAGVARLKTDYGIGHGYANTLMLVVRAEGEPALEPVERQYSGAKSGLRPVYDAILAHATGLGPDVEVAPKKDSVSLRRSKQFALVMPATRERIDLGLNLPGDPGGDRLKLAGGMCTHKVAVRTVADVDEELVGWLRAAYERA